MSETVAGVVGQIAAPVVAALLEDLHAAASAEITRLEATMPQRIASAEQTVQDWTADAARTFHGLIARIEGARANVGAAVQPGPTVAATTGSTGTSAATTAPASTTPSTTAPPAATNPAAAK